MGLFITLANPTAPMKKGAVSADALDTPFGKFTRLQIVTTEDLLAGKKPAMPPEDPAAFKRAAREEDETRQEKPIQPNSPHCLIGRVCAGRPPVTLASPRGGAVRPRLRC